MYDDRTLEHICKTRLETVAGVKGFLGFKIRHLKDAIHVDMFLDVDNLEVGVISSFELKPNWAKRELLNEIDEIAENVRTARLLGKWLPRVPMKHQPLPGTGLRGRWKDRASGEIISAKTAS